MDMREDLEKLLGGYATDTLTEQERQTLFEAALQDQALFNALANEQVLKELFDDPHARRKLIEALRQKPEQAGWYPRLRGWLVRPATLALAGSFAVIVLVVTLVLNQSETPLPKLDVATESQSPAPPTPAPTPTPMPEPGAKNLPAPPPATDTLRSVLKQSRSDDSKQAKDEGPRPAAVPQPESPRQTQELRAFAVEGKTQPSARELFNASAELAEKQDVAGLAGDVSKSGATREEPAPEKRSEEPQAPSIMARRSSKVVAKPALSPLGLRYTVQRETSDGSYADVDPSTTFHAGDKVRLAIEPNDDGYLYVLGHDASGQTHVIYPKSEQAQVQKNTIYTIPPGESFTFDQMRERRVTLIFSRNPVSDLEKKKSADKKEMDAIGRLKEETPSSGLMIQEDRADGDEKAVYAVKPRPDPTTTISLNVTLMSR